MRKILTLGLVGLLIVCGLAIVAPQGVKADTLFNEQFSGDVFASGDWWKTDSSVSVDTSNGWMRISSNGGYDSYAEKNVSFSLPLIIEARMKLESGGQNYRLPYITLLYGSHVNDSIPITYLPGSGFGWKLKDFTQVDTNAPPGENVWWTVKATIRSDGGELQAKSDADAAFTPITTVSWSIPNTITKIRFSQPWDAVCDLDYVVVSSSAITTTLPWLWIEIAVVIVVIGVAIAAIAIKKMKK